MKVCHITSVHRYDDPRIFLKECHSLSGSYEVHLIAPDGVDGVHGHVKVHCVPSEPTKIKRMIKTVRVVYKKALEVNADCYHFHDPELIRIGLKLRKKGKIVIYDVHEDVPKQILSKDWIPRLLKKPLSAIFERYEKFASRAFDAIVTATPQIEERFKPFNKHTITVQNFPLVEEWLKDIEMIKQASNQHVVYVGSITKPRGIFEMVKAIEIVNRTINVKLLLGGKFSSTSLEKEAKAQKGWEHVEFLGWLNREQVFNVYKNSAVGLVLIHPEPRYQVSYPVKLFEYMAAGIPVIVSNFPLWKEIVDEVQCGLTVNPLNPNEVAEAIVWVINHPEDAKKMGERGKSAVLNKYNWQNEALKLIKLYEKLANSKRNG